jgi:PKD repeat protein
MRNRFSTLVRAALIAAIATVGSACTLGNGEVPPLTGPSEFGLSIIAQATPDTISRDGNAQSTVTVTVRNASGAPVGGQRLAIVLAGATPGGTSVSSNEVTTNADGRATFAVTAPPSTSAGNVISLDVVPVGTNSSADSARRVTISLTPSNSGSPVPAFVFTPVQPERNANVVFDASTTTDEGGVCGDACTYTWDFAGTAGSGRVANHRFPTAGTYAVRLTVTDRGGARATTSQNVPVLEGTAPQAVINFSPNPPAILDTVTFSGAASVAQSPGRVITRYQWNFGDGGTAEGQTVGHVYTVQATYNVVLTVTDSAGAQATTSTSFTVANGVTAAFTFSRNSGRVVIFNAESSRGSSSGFGTRNEIVRYIWHFGDSTSTEETDEPIISHTFPNTNTYTVTLTVEDAAGRRDTVNNQTVIPQN